MNSKRTIFLLLLLLSISTTFLFAAGTITAVYIPKDVAGGGGTASTGYPFAVYVQITGFTGAANSTAYVKFYSSSNNYYMYKPTTDAWSNSTTYATSCPIVNVDASGNWSGWIYAKVNDAVGASPSLRAAWTGGTSTNTTSGQTFTILSMSGTPTGGWIVRTTSPAVNKAILAYSGGVLVGSYRTENNTITEGYTYGSGGFKIAVPAGVVDSLVTINDDGTRDQAFIGPWAITAGLETDASSGGSAIGVGSAYITPGMLQGGISQSLTIKIATDASHTLTNARVVVPGSWTWSQSNSDVTLTGGGSPVSSVTVDTISISGMSLVSSDTLQIQLTNMTPFDTTINNTFSVATGTSPDSILVIAVQPSVFVYSTPLQISIVKQNDVNGVPLKNNQLVTIRGVVSAANEFGGPSYMQDNTGGIAVFGSSFSTNVTVGDEVVVAGLVQPFSGLNEIVNPILISKLSTGNVLTPLIVTANQVTTDGSGGVELYEGLLIRMNAITVSGTGNWVYQNYTVSDASGLTQVRIDNNTNLIGAAIPGSAFDLIGVVGQFVSSSPYIGGYQVMPRFTADVIASGPVIATAPYESNITQTSMRINWTTQNPGTAELLYGTTTSYELGLLEPDTLLHTTDAIDMTGLAPATVYHVKAFSVAAGDTSFGSDLVVSTSSPSGSTGQINVYFNKNIVSSLAYGEVANGNYDLITKIISRINAAQYSIDVALYSLSASGYGDAVASALISAKGRGVKVRVICEADNSGNSGFQQLVSGGVPLITDKFDAVWNGQGLMHNKFLVFDAQGGAANNVWVWTGSWNITGSGTTGDRQNSIEFQDVAMANAYTMEFNQMWGSTTTTPNASNSRFGARKADITPHNFIVGGVPVSVYFSPSDQTTSHLAATINKAQSSVGFCMDTFTKKDLADAVIAEHTAFRKTRGIMDNNTDTGNQYAYLGANSVDVHLKGFSGALLHHKYLIVDAENPTGTDYIETGSHNWSTAAETQNDENAVILQSNRVANLYLQEFAARYYEAGGTDSIHLTLFPTIAFTPTSLILDSVDVGSTSQDSFKISNSGNGPLNVSGFSSTNPRFTVSPPTASIAPSDSETFTVTFAPTVSGFQTGKIVFTHNAIGSPDTVTVQGYGIDTTHFITFTTSVNNRWNMVSVPIKVADYRKTILFPTATSSAFAFSGGYITRDTLRKHEGYWLKFGSDQQPSFYGVAIAKDTFPVVASWNMIGSITYPVPVTAITQVPSGNVQTSYFGYSNGYVVADTIKPGQSYWVKVTSPGTLTLGTTPGSTLAKNDNVLDKLNSVTFTDAAGNKQTLYFGNSPDEKFTTAAFQMPPVPPAGAFDVRYRNGNLVVLRSTASTSQQQFPVDMQGATFPVTVTWNVSDMSSRYSLNVGNTPTTLTASGSMQLTESNGQSVTLTMDDGNLPQVYSLGQNYPNPFNPTTTISFALPKQSIVSLKIYSALGQQVLAIADQEQFDAGVHAMKIDGSSLSSGVYYYRIDAVATGDASTQFHATKSLLLLK